MISAYTGPLHFELPEPHDGGCWFRVVETSLPSHNDIADERRESPCEAIYELAPQCVAVLIRPPFTTV